MTGLERLLSNGNLFADLPDQLPDEQLDTLAEGAGLRVVRIVSTGQATPTGEWYDQDGPEWVVLLSGSAVLQFEGEPEQRHMAPGDWMAIPAHARHRVEATAGDEPTVWLAVHYQSADDVRA